METLVDAWNEMSWFDGFIFSVWIVVLYWIKKRIDYLNR